MSTRKKSHSPRTRAPARHGGPPAKKPQSRSSEQRQRGKRKAAVRDAATLASNNSTESKSKKASPQHTDSPARPPRARSLEAGRIAESLERAPQRKKRKHVSSKEGHAVERPEAAAEPVDLKPTTESNSLPARPAAEIPVAGEGLWATETGIGVPPEESPDDEEFLGIGSPVLPAGEMPDSLNGLGMSAAEVTEDQAYADDPSVEARIRDLQDRLDGLARESSTHLTTSEQTQEAPTAVDAEEAIDAAREVLESDYYRRKWGPAALRQRTNEIDEFGLDPDFEGRIRPLLSFLFERYFRVDVAGAHNLPERGRGMVVANHSGALPLDGTMLREAVHRHQPAERDLRWLADDWSFYLPFIGVALNRLGAVRACSENMSRLLERDHLVGCFPEGSGGTKKLFGDRYKLQRFGRGEFVRVALQTRSPIIPCAVIGAEESYPILYRFDNLSKLLGLDYLPITPTFPALGLFGLLPAPSKWSITFAEPIPVDDYGPEAASDHVLVARLTERVHASVRDLLDSGLRRRKSVWL